MDELGTDTSNEAGATARAAYRDGLIKVLDYLDTRLNDCRVVGKKGRPFLNSKNIGSIMPRTLDAMAGLQLCLRSQQMGSGAAPN